MKNIFLFLLITLIVFNLKAHNIDKPKLNGSNSFQIRGKVKNHIIDKNNGFITLRTYNVKGDSRDSAILIDIKGNFSCQLHQPFTGNFALLYDDKYIELYCSPAEKITIEIDENTWKTNSNKIGAITISGRSALVSKYMIDFQYQLDNHSFLNNPDAGNKEQDDEAFSIISHARMNEELNLLTEYFKKNRIGDRSFKDWAKNSILYSTGKTISYHCFAGKLNKAITYERFIGLFDSIPIVSKTALDNANYYEFLKILSTGLQIISNINPIYKDAIKYKGNSNLAFNLDKIDSISTGTAKELLYYYMYNQKNKDCEFYIARFNSTITNPYLKQLLHKIKSNAPDKLIPFDVIAQIKNHPLGNDLAISLASLLQKHKGSYIYLDFWGSWCGPCMLEMPNYPRLIDSLKNRPIAFIFLAVDTKEKDINEVKRKYPMNADFISLTGDETKILNNVLQFSSYPKHFIIDPSGKLVNNSISQLSSNISKIVEQIENTIAQKE
jgi:thiol-disulfide isomerase/thioredoxin